MKKKYTYYSIIVFLFTTVLFFGQEAKPTVNNKEQVHPIEGLTVYPNPNNSGKIFITSKNNEDKKVEIFNVLGKKVVDTVLLNKELNISQLNPGVYILKVTEGDASSSRKLILN